jgi:hypothetical protein
MKKLFSLAFACLSIFGAGSAMALNEAQTFAVSLNGVADGSANVVISGQTATNCSYDLQWTSGGGLGGECTLVEAMTVGHRSCTFNAFTNFSTEVLSSGTCIGFDQLGNPGDVSLFLGESGGAPTLSGLELPVSSPVALSINFT